MDALHVCGVLSALFAVLGRLESKIKNPQTHLLAMSAHQCLPSGCASYVSDPGNRRKFDGCSRVKKVDFSSVINVAYDTEHIFLIE